MREAVAVFLLKGVVVLFSSPKVNGGGRLGTRHGMILYLLKEFFDPITCLQVDVVDALTTATYLIRTPSGRY